METNELAWITDVIAKLQVPQTHNERQRLSKILEKAAPAIIAALDYTAMTGFSTYNNDENGDDILVKAGHTCNGCGQDHYFEEGNAKHYAGETKSCRVEDLFQILKELEEAEDK